MWTKILPTEYGPNLVTNGTFTGSAAGWTLGGGWNYGTNNVTYTYLGSEILTNGSFSGSAAGWTLGDVWAYSANSVHQVFGHLGNLTQTGLTITQNKSYQVGFDVSSISVNGTFPALSFRFLNTGAGTESYNYDLLLGPGTGLTGIIPNVAANRTTFFVSTGGSGLTLDNLSLKEIGTGSLSQNIGATPGGVYQIGIAVGGSAGHITVSLGGTSADITAGFTGTVQLRAALSTLSITASSAFNGTVDTVTAQLVITGYIDGWTKIPNPSEGGDFEIFAGEPIGLLLALTYATNSFIPNETWIKIPNAIGDTWTKIPNAT